ncbi:FAD binding domain-containing protein, partial [Chloroflexota bacterium]
MGTRILGEFDYLRPHTIEEALSLLGKYGDKASILAGGTDLLIKMKLLQVKPEYLVDITAIPKLRSISFDEKDLRVGTTVLLSELETSKVIQENYTALFEAICEMATTQVRNIATIGGNLCNASPAADTAPPLLVLEAKINIATQSGIRTVPLEDFFVGPGNTVLAAGDILTGISIAPPSQHMGTSFVRISRTSSDLAKLNVAAALTTHNGICEDAKIALGAVAPTPIRAKRAEAILKNRKLNQDAIDEAADMVGEEI